MFVLQLLTIILELMGNKSFFRSKLKIISSAIHFEARPSLTGHFYQMVCRLQQSFLPSLSLLLSLSPYGQGATPEGGNH